MDTKESKLYVLVLTGIGALFTLIVLHIYEIFRSHRMLRSRYRQYAEAHITAVDKERNRMAADFHDSFGGLLSVVKNQLEILGSNAPGHLPAIQEIIFSVGDLIGKVREVTHSMVPEMLIKFDPEVAVRDLVSKYQMEGRRKIHLVYELGNLSQEAALHIYHIIQEILNNAVKHSHATNIDVSLISTPKKVILKIKDNGVGFNKEILSEKPHGLGLNTIFTRISMLKGTVNLNTKPKFGVEYKIEFPKIYNE